MPRRSGYALALLLATSTKLAAQVPPPRATVARLADSLARDFIAARGAPGVSIAIVRGRDTLAMGGWGKADLENEVPATARSVYRIGSITKQFTSAAVLQLAEQGKVKLDDSIGTYLATWCSACSSSGWRSGRGPRTSSSDSRSRSASTTPATAPPRR